MVKVKITRLKLLKVPLVISGGIYNLFGKGWPKLISNSKMVLSLIEDSLDRPRYLITWVAQQMFSLGYEVCSKSHIRWDITWKYANKWKTFFTLQASFVNVELYPTQTLRFGHLVTTIGWLGLHFRCTILNVRMVC